MDNPVTSDIYHKKNELKDNRITDMLSDHTHYEKREKVKHPQLWLSLALLSYEHI